MRRIRTDYLTVSLCVCTVWIGVVLVSSAATAFNEAPATGALVADGNLPTVDKRLPRVPARYEAIIFGRPYVEE